MSKISRAEVEHVAHLARLKLTAEEGERQTRQLTSILGYIGKLAELKTDGVPVTAQVTGLSNVVRPDAVAGCPAEVRGRLLDAAPERSGDFISTASVFS